MRSASWLILRRVAFLLVAVALVMSFCASGAHAQSAAKKVGNAIERTAEARAAAKATKQYDETFRKYSKRYFGPAFDWTHFKAQSMAESNLDPKATSYVGARGLMQLMPATARQYGVRNSYDPKANIEAGVKHLKSLLSRLELPIALAAYNAGEGTIQRYGGLPPFPETQSYVSSILRRIGR